MRWRIYYGDGSAFTGDERDYFLAPTVSVQVIAQEQECRRGYILIHQKDIYVWRPALGWCGVDDAGAWDYRFAPGFVKYEIYGRTARDEDYHAAILRAQAEGLGP